MWTVTVRGSKYEVLPAERKKMKHGEMLLWREHRRVYRFICRDGDDYIMRNVRHPDVLEVFTGDVVEREFRPIVSIDTPSD